MTEKSPQSFNTLYTTYYRRAFLFVKSYVYDDLAAEDIVSDVLLKLWLLEKEGSIDFTKPLLLSALKNRVMDYLKHLFVRAETFQTISDKQQRELETRISTLEACDPEEVFSNDIQRIIETTLSSLPEQTRYVFELSRFENKTNKEIADKLDITVKGVEYHIAKSLKALRIHLKDYLPLFPFLYLLQ